MAYNDIMDADYYHLMDILSVEEIKEEDKIISLEEFVRGLG